MPSVTWTATLQGAALADTGFTSPTSVTIPILAAYPDRVWIEDGPRISYGSRAVQTTAWYRQITIESDALDTNTAATGDHGDLQTLLAVLSLPNLRVTDISTDRTDGSTDGAYWPAVLGSGLTVARVSVDVSHDNASGTDSVSLVLRSVEPQV